MPFATGPVLRYVGLGRYVTTGPTVYVGADDVITIPADYPTDLASVPRLFWALLPPQGAYERAAVLHDWLCDELARYRRHPGQYTAGQVVPSRDVDGLFRRVMREAGVGPVTRWIMWTGVRWGALANPARRAGWWRDAPLVLALTTVGLAALVAALVGVHHGIDWALELLAGQ